MAERYCPSPSPRGFPRSKDKAVGFAPPVAALPPPQSLHQPLKGGGTAPGRSRGPSGGKKRKHGSLRFFLCKAASMPPRQTAPADGCTMPARGRVFHHAFPLFVSVRHRSVAAGGLQPPPPERAALMDKKEEGRFWQALQVTKAIKPAHSGEKQPGSSPFMGLEPGHCRFDVWILCFPGYKRLY